MTKLKNFIVAFLRMVISPYVPKRAFVSESALAFSRTTEIIVRLKKLNPKIHIIYILTNTPPRPKLKGRALYKYLKESIVLCTRSSQYMEVFASPGNISENLGIMGKLHFHCALRCTFCYLDVAGRGTPWTRVYMDLENFYEQGVKERIVYKMVLTLWSAISFHQKNNLNKVPEKFKEVCDKTIREKVHQKRNGINSDKEAILFLKNNLQNLFAKMNINLTAKEEEKIIRAIPGYYRKNSQYPLSINVGEYTDVIGLDHITNVMDEMMQLVQKDPEFRIRFRSKATNIHNLLKYNGNNQVAVAFDLNTAYVIDRYEIGTATLKQRIAAINALIQRGGYKIEIAIEPIIKYDGYENDYKALIARIKSEIDLFKVSKIKVGTVRYKTRLLNFIKKTHPKSDLVSKNQQLVAPEKGDKRWRYSKEERLKIYQIIKNELKNVPNIKLGLGSENPELWDELGLDKSGIHTDTVFQYKQKQNNKSSNEQK